MNIQILQLVEGARAARGITVIIDVFRAFSLEAYLLAMGAERILPVGDVELAYRLKGEHPEYLLAGERHGKILPGFDMGNAPSELSRFDVRGKTVVHTTSAGTQGIANATCADELLGASLVNAAATAEYIRRSGRGEVSLVCMGLEALAPSDEDTLCADYIKSLLLGEPMNIRSAAEALRYTTGAKFFNPAEADVFPTGDFPMCIDVDRFGFVMKLTRPQSGVPYITKEDVLL